MNKALTESCLEACTARFRAEKNVKEVGELKETQKSLGDYREGPGCVGALWCTQADDYTYDAEMAKMSRYMSNRASAELMIPQIKRKDLGALGSDSRFSRLR